MQEIDPLGLNSGSPICQNNLSTILVMPKGGTGNEPDDDTEDNTNEIKDMGKIDDDEEQGEHGSDEEELVEVFNEEINDGSYEGSLNTSANRNEDQITEDPERSSSN